MKNISIKPFLLGLVSLLLLAGCLSQKKVTTKRYALKLTNPSLVERAEELVVLTREMIEQRTGALAENKYISITDQSNKQQLVQFDDMNKDGRWDEACFLYTFKPGETVQLTLSQSNALYDTTSARAHVRMRKKNADNTFGPLLDSVTILRVTPPTDFTKQALPPYLTEGPAWENDKVAFRLYMDTRNTKDIFGKKTAKMMMDIVGVNPSNSYHNSADWGMDILAVGKSLGAGSLALSVPGVNGKDTLVRLGGANVEQTTFEKVADGPLRAILRMHYKNWTVSNNVPPVNVTEEISIGAGKYYYLSKVTVTNAPQGSKLVTGIVNLKSKSAVPIDTGNSKGIYTYDVQSENNDHLGLAIIVQNKNYIASGKTVNAASEVLNTYTVALPVSLQPAEFRFYAGWERSDLLFTREESFRKFLDHEAVEYGDPIIVSFE